MPPKKDSANTVKTSKKDSEKNVKTSQFVLVVWSKKVRGKVAYSVQPDATVKDANQLYNPRIESFIEDRLILSDDPFEMHLGRVLRHGTKAFCNNDAKKHVEEFSAMLEEEAKEDERVSDSDSNDDNETKETDEDEPDGKENGKENGNKDGKKDGRKDGRKDSKEDGRKDSKEDGRKDGRKDGKEDGRKDGKEDGRKYGKEDGRKYGRKDGKEDEHEPESEDERVKDVCKGCNKIERELQETKKQFENYKQITKDELKEKDSEIAKLTKMNLFLQTTLPEKIEETFPRSSKSSKASEPMAEWNKEEEKLNLNTKQERELKSKYKSSLLARACLTFCFPTEVLAKSVVKGGNQQLSKDDPKLDEDKVDDICEFVMARFPESDRKNILNTLGYKVRDLKRKANAMEKSTDD